MKQRYSLILTAVLMLMAAFSGSAAPAMKGRIVLCQPDGKTFYAYLKGDEFTRIKTTEDGLSIIQDENGWWCYASYQPDGSKTCSGWKVGEQAPQTVLDDSRRIPYDILSAKASRIRSELNHSEGMSVLKRMMKSRMETKADAGNTGPAVKHGLVILAAFDDVPFTYKKEDFIRLLTEDGYSVNGATGSAKEYFDSQFDGTVKFDFHVSDIVKLQRHRAYYGANDNSGNDKAPAEMIRDACKLVDDDIDFSMFDDDGDGYVDNVFLFFAGPDEAEGASEDCIWSHAWYIYSSTARIDLVCDGKRIDRYACSSELALHYDQKGNVSKEINTIGTFCHEYSHTLGLPDFYDTDYESTGGMSAGLWGQTSLMDNGNYNNLGNTPPYFNALERMLLGLQTPMVLEGTGNYTLDPIHKGGVSYILNTDTEGEFFLMECRKQEGWDTYIGGSGMLVYHIDATEGGYAAWNNVNEVNIDPAHQMVDLLEADGRIDAFPTFQEYAAARQSISGIFFPYNESTSLSKDTDPGLISWDGTKSIWSITSIRRDGEGINFNLIGESGVEPPTVRNLRSETFPDGAIIMFESSFAFEGEASVSWGRPGKEYTEIQVSPYRPGQYAVILENLEASGTTYEVNICFSSDGIVGESHRSYIMTKRKPPVKWPFITFGSADRNDDGTFPDGCRIPLHVNNAFGAAETVWSFNGKKISHEGDGYYTLTGNGELKAVIHWKDGSTDTIVKTIRIAE